jgi:hypothetical protein
MDEVIIIPTRPCNAQYVSIIGWQPTGDWLVWDRFLIKFGPVLTKRVFQAVNDLNSFLTGIILMINEL